MAAVAEVTTDEDILTELSVQYVAGVQAGNVAWFDEHLTEDFRVTNPDGGFYGKQEFLKMLAQPPVMSGMKERDILVRVFDGKFAIIHAEINYKAPDGSQQKGRWTDDWIKQSDGSWKCVSAHTVGEGFS